MYINPDYYLYKEIEKRDKKIISLNDELADVKYELKKLKLKFELINHPLKK